VARIVIWLGPAPATWDPATALLRGIGGSETAAIYVSDELARLGHDVEVYADVPRVQRFGLDEHPDHPVTFFPYHSWVPRTPCYLFVSSRQPVARRDLAPRCGQAWLWMHDLHCGPDWDNVLGTDYDRILCLSRWAREQFLSYYPAVSPDKVEQTRNGLDLSLFRRLETAGLRPGDQHLLVKPAAGYGLCRKPLRATYSSSPDRGLARLLDFWPKIFAKYGPDSSLHVYYGFETWRRLAALHDLRDQLAQADLLEHSLATTPGVVYHGRASQEEVARSYLQSQLWLYPTDFQETSCITAMEAQAAGCHVVATRCGALPETAPQAWFVDGPTRAPDYEARFLAAVDQAMGSDYVYVPQIKSWAEVAAQWDDWITSSEVRS